MKYLAMKKDYCTGEHFEWDFCQDDMVYRNSVLVFADKWKKEIEKSYLNVSEMICSLAYYRAYYLNNKDIYEDAFRWFSYDCERIVKSYCDVNKLYPYQINKIKDVIDYCFESESIWTSAYSGTCAFNCTSDEEQGIVCDILNHIFLGSKWEAIAIRGCCQGDYAEILIDEKAHKNLDYFVEFVEAEFFNTGNAYDVWSVDDSELYDVEEDDVTSAIMNEWSEEYCIPWSNEEKEALAYEIGCEPDDIVFIEEEQTIVKKYTIYDY